MNYSDIEYGLQLVANDRAKASEDAGYPIGDVTSEEIEQSKRFADGSSLKGIIDTDGYQIIFNKLHSYMDEYITTAMNTDRTNDKAIWANTITAQVGRDIVQRLKSDIAADIEMADNPPAIIKQSIRLARSVVPKN